jgi:DNA helicase-2/ATP-dependent DNA helicase PcrA
MNPQGHAPTSFPFPLSAEVRSPPASSADADPSHDLHAGLNPRQRQAAQWGQLTEGRFSAPPLLVIAGAGTGKTATLAHRVAHLVAQGVDPSRILLLTFSRRAAHEMTHRAALLLRGNHNGSARHLLPWAGTFHSIGARLLRQHAAALGLPPGFGVLDRPDSADLIDTLRDELGLASARRRFPRKDTCLAIYSRRVNTGSSLAQVIADQYPWCKDHHDSLAELFGRYVARKQADGVLDFDDLLLWWEAALNDPAQARAMGERFDHILVDEYQDSNRLQASIVRRLRPDGTGVFVVGDDAQSIYAFRGAAVENILGFAQQYAPPAARITLDVNYRSLQPVLDAANALLADSVHQYPKTLVAHRRHCGQRPGLVCVLDEREQADFITEQVLAQREAGIALKRQAVLFRSAQHSDFLEVELTRRNIPFVKHGGLKFLEAAHIKDLLAVLRWADRPAHRVAAFRALQLMPGFGPAHARRCLEMIAGRPDPLTTLAGFAAPPASAGHWPAFVELMAQLASPDSRWPHELGPLVAWLKPLLAERYDNPSVRATDLDGLAAIAARFASRERFLTELALDPPQASGDLSDDALRDEDFLELSTVHSAKGREWHTVFVLNVADGNFPNEYATSQAAGIEEERRLLYVAMTRARDTLHLIEPQRYYVTGQPRLGADHVLGARSRFLTPAVMACLELRVPGACEPAATSRPDAALPDAPASPSGVDTGRATDIASRMRQMW